MRRATVGDIGQLVELMDEFYAESSYNLDRERAAKAFVAIVADRRFGDVWLIECESMSVGYLVLTRRYGMEYAGLMACLDDLFVRPAFRNRGLATRALSEALASCIKLGIRAATVEVARDNGAAMKVYKRAGFVETERQLLTLALADPAHSATQ